MDRLLLGRPCGLEEKTEEAKQEDRWCAGSEDIAGPSGREQSVQPDKNMSTPFFFFLSPLLLFIPFH